MCRNDILFAQKIIQLVIHNPFENFSYNRNDSNSNYLDQMPHLA